MKTKGETKSQTMPYGRLKGCLVEEVPDAYLEWLQQSSHDNFYTLKAELERREKHQPEPQQPFVLSFGSYKGQAVTQIPDTYIRYLINESYKAYHLSKNELEIRSNNPELSIKTDTPTEL